MDNRVHTTLFEPMPPLCIGGRVSKRFCLKTVLRLRGEWLGWGGCGRGEREVGTGGWGREGGREGGGRGEEGPLPKP